MQTPCKRINNHPTGPFENRIGLRKTPKHAKCIYSSPNWGMKPIGRGFTDMPTFENAIEGSNVDLQLQAALPVAFQLNCPLFHYEGEICVAKNRSHGKTQIRSLFVMRTDT